MDTTTGRLVAIKRVSKESYKRGINMSGVKEAFALHEVSHANVLRLYEIFTYGERLHLVLEFCVADLSSLIKDRSTPLSEAAVKCVMGQLLAGLAAVHAVGLLHRDLKPDNLLFAPNGDLKLADFGHAARAPAGSPLTAATEPPMWHEVVTLWYRAPELLCGAKFHGPPVDIWAAGCIFGELLLRQPLFCATEDSPLKQMAAIIRLLGTPVDPLVGDGVGGGGDAPPAPASSSNVDDDARTGVDWQAGLAADSAAGVTDGPCERESLAQLVLAGGAPSRARLLQPSSDPLAWPGCSSLPGWAEFQPRSAQPWRAIFAAASPSAPALDLLSKLLVYDPNRRWSAAQALQHPWFAAEPRALQPAALPLPAAARAAAGLALQRG